MAVFKPRDVCSSLETKGFVLENNDHHYYRLYINGKRTSIRTHVSHNKEDITDGLIDFMKKETKLTKSEFVDLINCPLSKEKYAELMIERGYVSMYK